MKKVIQDRALLEQIKMRGYTFPTIEFILDSLKFTDTAKTRGTFKLSCITKGHMTHETKEMYESAADGRKHYVYKDVVEDKFKIKGSFETTEYGLWVKMPSKKVVKPAAFGTDGKPSAWEDVIDDVTGKPKYRPTWILTGHNGVYRNKTLTTMVAAAIEVKAGRFKYHEPEEKDYYFAWRDARSDEDSLTGRVGVKHDQVQKLRDDGVEVMTQPNVKSCTNCSNMYRMFESDDDSGFDVPGLPSRPVSELAEFGVASACRCCTVRKEIMDIEACDWVNEMLQYDYSDFTNRNGWRQKVGEYEVALDKFSYGKAKTLVSQKWNDEEDEPEKLYAEETYEGSYRVKMSVNDLIAMRLEADADQCPMWTRAEKDYGIYEWPKVDKCGVLSMSDKGWELCTNNKQAKRAGKDWKFAVRYHGLQLSYNKKTILERQEDFLGEFESWIKSPVDLRDRDKTTIDKMTVEFASTVPEKSVRDRWLIAGNEFFKELWPLTAEDETLRDNLTVVGVHLASL